VKFLCPQYRQPERCELQVGGGHRGGGESERLDGAQPMRIEHGAGRHEPDAQRAAGMEKNTANSAYSVFRSVVSTRIGDTLPPQISSSDQRAGILSPLFQQKQFTEVPLRFD
jgi:hypothetical protein